MAMRAIQGSGDDEPRADREGRRGPIPLRRARPRPTGRAVTGGLLVAVATVALFVLGGGGGDAGGGAPVVVAARDLAPGEVLSPADVRLEMVDLPPSLQARTFRDPAAVDGVVVAGTLRAGELVQAGGLARRSDTPFEVSVPVADEATVGGRLRSGDRIDLLATYGNGEQAWTMTAARDATVVLASGGGDGLASSDTVVTLGLHTPGEAVAVAHAARAATLTVVRSTPPVEAPLPDGYRPVPLVLAPPSVTGAIGDGATPPEVVEVGP